MPLDYELAIVAAVQGLLTANTDVTAAFPAGNIHDDRTTGAARRRLAQRTLQDFPSLDVEIVGGEEQATRTPHFGMAGTVVVTDAIIPVVVTLRLTMKYRKDDLGTQTAPESHVRRAIHQGYPKMVLPYVRDFTIRKRRTPSAQTDDGITAVQWDITINLRLHLSQLRD